MRTTKKQTKPDYESRKQYKESGTATLVVNNNKETVNYDLVYAVENSIAGMPDYDDYSSLALNNKVIVLHTSIGEYLVSSKLINDLDTLILGGNIA